MNKSSLACGITWYGLACIFRVPEGKREKGQENMSELVKANADSLG